MVTNSVRRNLLASTIIAGALVASAPAFAQGTVPAEAAAETAEDSGTIIVTGSLIQNPNLTSSSPVSVIGAEEVALRQSNTAEQILRDLPGAVPNVGQNVNNGNNGASYVDLRGLGSTRNIVLLDGTRIVPSGTAGRVDLNNIPLALVERVDALTGGASTTYGADAVSGVVNFITRRDFAGMDLSVSEQITEQGDGNVLRVDLSIGANFDDGRGNAVLSVGYQEADPIYFGDRDYGTFTISSATGRASGDSFTSVPTLVSFAAADLQVSPDNSSLVPFYNAFNFNPYNVYATPFERFNIYGAARYEVTDSIEVYTRALFSKNTVDTIIAPSGVFGESLTIPGNNPFLNATIRDQLCVNNGLAPGATCAANPAIPLPAVYRRTVELGPRISNYVTDIFDYRAGVRVGVTDTINLNISGGYGESTNIETRKGYVAKSRLQQALNANNTTTCTVNTNGCVPLNLFGQAGSITGPQAAFIGGLTSSIARFATLAQAQGILSGDFGVNLPWAEESVAFAVGTEYRKYTSETRPDNLAQVPGELGGAGGAVSPVRGGYDVYEGFGELIVPIASDRPFFNELTLEAGVRYSRYSIDAPGKPTFSATTYKGGINWEPVEGLKFRGNYQHAVRAPNIAELFQPVSTGLTNLLVDPCAGAAPTTNANLAAICIAQGAPVLSVTGGLIQNPSAGQANSTGGGNPLLTPENADTYTIGVVIAPSGFISGLTVSLDYYHIKITEAVTTPTPSDVIGACFNNITAASATSLACTSIRRSTANGRLSGSPASVAGLPQPLSNLGTLETDGIDLVVNFKRDLGFAGLNLNFAGNWTNRSLFQATKTSINRECVGLYSVACSFTGSIQPEFSWNQRTTLTFDNIDISLLWRHISSVKHETGNLFSGVITGRGALVGQTLNFNKIKAYDYFDLTARVGVTDNFDFTFSAFNILNKKPPIVGSSAGSTSFNGGNTYPSTYDTVGRRYAVTARIKY